MRLNSQEEWQDPSETMTIDDKIYAITDLDAKGGPVRPGSIRAARGAGAVGPAVRGDLEETKTNPHPHPRQHAEHPITSKPRTSYICEAQGGRYCMEELTLATKPSLPASLRVEFAYMYGLHTHYPQLI